ncbi:MAG: DUF4249 family protein [Bacteroidales bacterium]
MPVLAMGILLGAATSCTEKIEWDLNTREMDLIVVEGHITSDPGPQEVTLTHPTYEMNAVPDPVRGAVVEIFDGVVLHPFAEDPDQPGVYRSDSSFAVRAPRGYQLRIRHRDKTIRGVSFSRAVDDFPFMTRFVVQEDPLLYEAYVADTEHPSVLRMELDWSGVPGYDTLPAEDTHALVYHYTLGGVDVNRIFAPQQEHVSFPPGTVVYRELESVPPGYEEYLRGILSETDWRGGVFDVLPGNAATNLEGNALGYFTCGEVIRDTLVVR